MFGVTLVQLFPPSRVTCTRPSLVPAQITPLSFGDSAMAKTTLKYSTLRLSIVRPPESPSLLRSFRVRSGLISRQVTPPSFVASTYWLPM
jgi:hypothetical protein